MDKLDQVAKKPILAMLDKIDQEKLVGSYIDNLTQWEASFIGDILDRYIMYRGCLTLSQKQADIIQKIYDKLMEGCEE